MPVTIVERATGVLLTKGDIDAWKNEISDLEAEADRISNRMEEIFERISAAEYFLKLASPTPAAPKPLAVNQPALPLTDAIMRVMEREQRPLTAAEIRTQVSRDPQQALRLKANPNYFHTAMKRLRDRKLVIREGDTDCLPPKENGAQATMSLSAPEAGGAVTPPNHSPSLQGASG